MNRSNNPNRKRRSNSSHERNRDGRTRGGNRNYGNRSRRSRSNHRGEKISHDRYIAKAEEGYVAPSIYEESKVYEDYRINEPIKRNIKKKGYKHPTKIQADSIPLILDGRDILGLASTGSGKTAAFLIPMIDKILDDQTQRCLIIVPTRELAEQIRNEFKQLTIGIRIYSTVLIGGKNIRSQIGDLRRDPQFIIGTPGRLKDLYERDALDLEKFNNIVLDEVDRMLDMGFFPDISFLISKLPAKKQTLFFSATMTPDAEKIANSLLNDPVKVQTEKESPLKRVDQDIVKVRDNDEKIEKLTQLLRQEELTKVLIFSRTKYGADKISRKLQQSGFKASSIHGGKAQNKRQRVLSDFKSDAINILVATDVAARGIDIPNVSHVINYDEPENYKDYIHRIGRTGRAGRTGVALTFVM